MDATDTPIAVQVDDVCKTYVRGGMLRSLWGGKPGEVTHALRNINFTIKQGETIGLLGPNGAGKTTLLKILATLVYPTAGSVRILGQNSRHHQQAARGQIGLITCDERSFYWRLTGRQNLRFFAALYRLSRRDFEDRSTALLDVLGLTDAADRPYHTYSAGMKQKLAIARGLLSEPRIVLYDEPTRSLDPLSTQNIRRWIADHRRTSKEQTHIIATNQLDEAEQLCDRVIIVNRGVIIAEGTMQEIRDRWHQRDYEVHRITVKGRFGDQLLSVDSTVGLLHLEQESNGEDVTSLLIRAHKGSDALSAVLRTLLDASCSILVCQRDEVPFDEIFCSLVLGEGNSSAESAEGVSIS